MKNYKIVVLFLFTSFLMHAQVEKTSDLYKTITNLDAAFFEAYNTCDQNLAVYSAFYDEDVEFFHDKGGLTTVKQEIIDGTKKNICGKVTRQLVKDSLEVYPIKDYGAIEIGYHKFTNNQEKEAISKPVKFIIMWKQTKDKWKISKVISLH